MDIALIDGRLFSLGLTLYVIPAPYTYLSNKKGHPEDTEIETAKPESATAV